MPEWAKNVTLIAGLGGWLATVIFSLSRGSLPDAATLGVPAVLVVALAPPGSKLWGRRGRNGASSDEEAENEAEPSR